MDLKQEVGKKIKYYRSLKDLTVQELADKVNVSIDTIYSYESGKKIAFPVLEKIANVLNIQIKLLFDFENENLNNKELIEKINFLCKDKLKEDLEFIIDFIKLLEKYN